jgi:hypothetical protein
MDKALRTGTTRVLAGLALICLAACSGGNASTPLAGATTAATNVVAPAKATAQFTITLPGSSQTASTRHAAFLSSATQSIVITLSTVNRLPYSGPSAIIASNLTTANPNCSGLPLTCTIVTLGLTGTNTFTLATYDAPQTSASSATPAGNRLAQATVSTTIVANATNAIAIVLNGIPAELTFFAPTGANAGTPITQSASVAVARRRAVEFERLRLVQLQRSGHRIRDDCGNCGKRRVRNGAVHAGAPADHNDRSAQSNLAERFDRHRFVHRQRNRLDEPALQQSARPYGRRGL